MLLLIGLLAFTGLSASPITTIRNIFIANPERGDGLVNKHLHRAVFPNNIVDIDAIKTDTKHFLQSGVKNYFYDSVETTFIGYPKALIAGMGISYSIKSPESFWPIAIGLTYGVHKYRQAYSYQPYSKTENLSLQYKSIDTENWLHKIDDKGIVATIFSDCDPKKKIRNSDAQKIRSLFSQSSYLSHNLTSSVVGILTGWYTNNPKTGLMAALSTRIGLGVASTACNAYYLKNRVS